MQLDNYYVFFKAKVEWIAMVMMIIEPPMIVSMLGCSRITNQTQRGPNIVSSKKKRLTSAAVIYLGANVIRTNGIATQKMPIAGMMTRSFPSKLKLSTKISAISATNNLPIIAEGTKLTFLADLIMTAPVAMPNAQISPKKIPFISPFSKESKKI